jgi:hypothetical protein
LSEVVDLFVILRAMDAPARARRFVRFRDRLGSSSGGALPKADPGPTAILIDEFHASGF